MLYTPDPLEPYHQYGQPRHVRMISSIYHQYLTLSGNGLLTVHQMFSADNGNRALLRNQLPHSKCPF
jgi:hypothetical protein